MTDEEIQEVSVSQLIQAVEETRRYAFLIGAGTSRPAPAGIPTAGELIDRWRQECYKRENPEIDLNEWVEHVEKNVDDSERYGFWFEKRHPARGQRRERIRDLVEDAEPTPYHIILALLMSQRTEKNSNSKSNYVPHTLTPNFDDLLFDAFHRYLEDRPQLINHRAIAPEFRVTRDRPTIVKLHGDYLYDNLQNTDDETKTLETELQEILEQVVREYGLVVVGYGGYDKSIMEPLLSADIEYGIYWCARDSDNLSPMAEKLLERPNTFLVPIESFESLMAQFGNQIKDVNLPTRDELVDRAERRADQLDGALQIRGEAATDKEEEEFIEKENIKIRAAKANRNGEHKKAIRLMDQLIESASEDADCYFIRGIAKDELGQHRKAIKDYNQVTKLTPHYARAYTNRGKSKSSLGEYEAAIEDFDQALKLTPEDTTSYNNRGIAKLILGDVMAAIDDFDQAIELDPDLVPAYVNRAEAKIQISEFESARQSADTARSRSTSLEDSAVSQFLYLVSTILLDREIQEEENKYRELCDKDFVTTWSFDVIESWLETADLHTEKRDKVQELMELLQEHKVE